MFKLNIFNIGSILKKLKTDLCHNYKKCSLQNDHSGSTDSLGTGLPG